MKIRRGGIAVVAGLCGLALVSTVAVSHISGGAAAADGAGGAGRGAALLAAMVRDPLAFLAMRSPGERGSALLNSKHARVASQEDEPTERVLATVRERPPGAASDQPPVFWDSSITPLDDIAPEALLPLAALGQPVEPELVQGFMPPILGPGGGGFTSRPGPEGGTQPAPPTPVPEPATWLTMLLGLFVIGGTIRRGRARLTRPEVGAAEAA